MKAPTALSEKPGATAKLVSKSTPVAVESPEEVTYCGRPEPSTDSRLSDCRFL